jgi:hypothetical protein
VKLASIANALWDATAPRTTFGSSIELSRRICFAIEASFEGHLWGIFVAVKVGSGAGEVLRFLEHNTSRYATRNAKDIDNPANHEENTSIRTPMVYANASKQSDV